MLTPCTANTIAAKPALTTTRVARNVQPKAVNAPTGDERRIKKWSLIRLHFQFQALIIQPLCKPYRALQSPAFHSNHDGFCLVQIFR